MITITMEDCDFLISSGIFCSKIEKYSFLLNLDSEVISAYKSENYSLNQLLLSRVYQGSTFEFYIQHKIQKMRITLNHLFELCKSNENYTEFIGRELGMEEQHEDSGLYKFLLN